MRVVVVVVLACVAWGCAPEPEAPAQATVLEDGAGFDTALLRVALSVRDLDNSKHFYSYVLGMQAGFDGDITSPAVLEMLQLDDGQSVRFAILRSAQTVGNRDVTGAMIGLLEVSNPVPQHMQRPPGATMATGEGVLAMLTSDIYAIEARLKEVGATILYGPKASDDGSEAEVVFYDPDGIRVHVVEMFE